MLVEARKVLLSRLSPRAGAVVLVVVVVLLLLLLLLTHLRVLVNLSLDSIGSRLVLICLHGFDQFHSCHFQGDRLVLVLEMLEDRRDHT
jgi:hypothetical protein